MVLYTSHVRDLLGTDRAAWGKTEKKVNLLTLLKFVLISSYETANNDLAMF